MSTTSKPPTTTSIKKVVAPKDTEQQGASPCDKCITCCNGCDGRSSESSSSESSEEKSAPETIQLLRRMVENAKLAELGKMSSPNQYKLVPVYDVVPYPSAFIQPFGRQSRPHPYAPAPNPVNVAYHQPMQHLHLMRNY
ncbi:Hypothetical predicted protein [Cloeon dipterum]|uniref:Uncharacterized protein n=1 Tax=Cloeon dipterum TaxID=197152 RepID=A0A8S1CKI5_9INSE|nr:Hypothetical predicted protein [Cloeon dipterum]